MSHAFLLFFSRLFFFLASWKICGCFIFPRKRSFTFFPMSHKLTHKKELHSFLLVNFFPLFSFSLFFQSKSSAVQVQIHRNPTALLGIHFCPLNGHCHGTSLFSCSFTNTFLTSPLVSIYSAAVH